MIYGDATPLSPAVPWEKFEYPEYLYRLEDLMVEFWRAHEFAHIKKDEPQQEWAEAQCLRRRRELEETALEFVAYTARLELEAKTKRSI